MHALFHRALTPQTITSAWLVATVALTLALAVAQAALASAASPARGGLPAAHALLAGPHGPHAPRTAHGEGARACRTGAPADDARAGGTTASPVRTCRATASERVPALRTPPVPVRHAGADALAVLYGGTGPHGPPAGAETQPILVSTPDPSADLDLDSTLSLRVATAVVTTFEVLPSLVSPTDLTA